MEAATHTDHIFSLTLSEIVFFLTLMATFASSFLGRKHGAHIEERQLSEHKLNKWLVGLSAGAAGNSGFIVAGVVGLGYTYGLQWILLPISWMLGDFVFWSLFPNRINELGRKSYASTIAEMLSYELPQKAGFALKILCSVIILFCLTGYVSAQWLAGQKFIAGAFILPSVVALAVFAVIIITYTTIGGFRGSVYTDILQAIIRLLGTALILGAIVMAVMQDPETFHRNIATAGPEFLNPFPSHTLVGVVGFMLGFAAASLGFGLGEPHLVSRYLAGSSPKETQGAWWIYIGFVQFTWLAMQVFGILLRGVMPGISEPEAGVSIYFQHNVNAVITGLVVADVFATIAATSNSLLVAMSQAVVHDLIPAVLRREKNIPLGAVSLVIGALTMLLSLIIGGSVATIALSSISILGSGLGPAVMIKTMKWRHTGESLIASIISGIAVAVAWKVFGYDSAINEAAAGIAAGLITNALIAANRK